MKAFIFSAFIIWLTNESINESTFFPFNLISQIKQSQGKDLWILLYQDLPQGAEVRGKECTGSQERDSM